MGVFSFSVPVSCPRLPAQRRFRCCSPSLTLMRLVPFHSHFWTALIKVLWPLFWPAGVEPITFIFSTVLLCFRLLKWIPDLQQKTSVTVSHNKSIGKKPEWMTLKPRAFYLYMWILCPSWIWHWVGCSFSASASSNSCTHCCRTCLDRFELSKGRPLCRQSYYQHICLDWCILR